MCLEGFYRSSVGYPKLMKQFRWSVSSGSLSGFNRWMKLFSKRFARFGFRSFKWRQRNNRRFCVWLSCIQISLTLPCAQFSKNTVLSLSLLFIPLLSFLISPSFLFLFFPLHSYFFPFLPYLLLPFNPSSFPPSLPPSSSILRLSLSSYFIFLVYFVFLLFHLSMVSLQIFPLNFFLCRAILFNPRAPHFLLQLHSTYLFISSPSLSPLLLHSLTSPFSSSFSSSPHLWTLNSELSDEQPKTDKNSGRGSCQTTRFQSRVSTHLTCSLARPLTLGDLQPARPRQTYGKLYNVSLV